MPAQRKKNMFPTSFSLPANVNCIENQKTNQDKMVELNKSLFHIDMPSFNSNAGYIYPPPNLANLTIAPRVKKIYLSRCGW